MLEKRKDFVIADKRGMSVLPQKQRVFPSGLKEDTGNHVMVLRVGTTMTRAPHLWILLLVAALLSALGTACPAARYDSTKSVTSRPDLPGMHGGNEVCSALAGAGGKFGDSEVVGCGFGFVLCLRGGGARNKWRRKMNKNGGGGIPGSKGPHVSSGGGPGSQGQGDGFPPNQGWGQWGGVGGGGSARSGFDDGNGQKSSAAQGVGGHVNQQGYGGGRPPPDVGNFFKQFFGSGMGGGGSRYVFEEEDDDEDGSEEEEEEDGSEEEESESGDFMSSSGMGGRRPTPPPGEVRIFSIMNPFLCLSCCTSPVSEMDLLTGARYAGAYRVHH